MSHVCRSEEIWPTKAKPVSLSEVTTCDGELCFAVREPDVWFQVSHRMIRDHATAS